MSISVLATPSQFYCTATIKLLLWVVSLRTNQFDLVSRIDPSWKKDWAVR